MPQPKPRTGARRVPRVQVYPDLGGQAGARFEVTLVDLSILGVCLEHTHQMQHGQAYVLDLNLGTQSVRVAARAIWSSAHRAGKAGEGRRLVYRTGLEFTDLAPDALAALQALIAERWPPPAREGTR